MLFNWLYQFADQVALFNLFKYITVRSGGALFTSFFIALIIGPWVIQKFRKWQSTNNTVKLIAHSQETINAKAGTPTMGGALIMTATIASMFIWADLSNPYVWAMLCVGFSFAMIGFIDDYLNLKKMWKNGLPGKFRLALQLFVSAAVVYLLALVHGGSDAHTLYVPFFKDVSFDLGLYGFMAFGALVVAGSANSVNLTDGLDGLVAIPAVIVAASFGVLAYIIGRTDFTQYLNVAYIPGAGEIAVVCASMVGALLGFLWFNAPPARIFMGDTGSLAVGGMLGTSAIILKQEFVLAIVGGLFVLETLSVIIQVISFKTTGKRVFKMAPLHHHFEKQGWPETTIVVRFWIIALLLALVGMATLKLR